MSAYLETQLAVYQHLLARHEQEPTFRFSVRKKDLHEGLFPGQAKSGDFNFTLWNIPGGNKIYPLTYVVYVKKGRLSLELLCKPQRKPQDEQERGNLIFFNDLNQHPAFRWSHSETYLSEKRGPFDDLRPMLMALDGLLAQTVPAVEATIAVTQTALPHWQAERWTAAEFERMLTRLTREHPKLLAGTAAERTEALRRPDQLARLPAAWTIGLGGGGRATAAQAGTLTFKSAPANLVTVQPNDLLIAVAHGSDRIALGLGKVRSPVVRDSPAAAATLAVEWLSTERVRLQNNSYSLDPLARSKKGAQTVLAYESKQPDLLQRVFDELSDELSAEPGQRSSAGEADEFYSAAAARAEGVFLSEEDIQEMVEALRVKQNVILKGPPGVGKTFVARKLAYVLFGAKDPARIELVQFHQAVSYEDFVRGWRPGLTGSLAIEDGPLLRFVARARADARPHVLIIDEINRGNLSRIFGELFMLLEADKRTPEYGVRLTYPNPTDPNERFFLPPNLYLIGTMNTADRSLALVDYALRRRFRFFDLRPHLDESLVHFLAQAPYQADPTLLRQALNRVQTLNEIIERDPLLGPGFAIGHASFCPPTPAPLGDVAVWFGRVVRHELLPLLEEYWDGDAKGQKKLAEQRAQLTAPLLATPPSEVVPAVEAPTPDAP